MKRTKAKAPPSQGAPYCTGKHCPECGKPIVESPPHVWPYWTPHAPFTVTLDSTATPIAKPAGPSTDAAIAGHPFLTTE